MIDVEKVITVAHAEVGYLEKKSNKDLDSKTANAGSNNWTKYGRDLIKWIGSPYANGVAWCDEFVDWCFIIAYGKTEAKRLLGGWSAYTPTSAGYFKNMNRWYRTPKKGDVIFFKNTKGVICHTGIVEAVDSTHVYTVEGNTSGANGVIANGGGVCRKKYTLNYYRIAGYGRPDYGTQSAPVQPTYKSYQGGFPIIPPTLKKGSRGLQVERLQKFLNWYGNYGLVVDGIFGQKTYNAVLSFQKKVFYNDVREWDGMFGKKSLDKAKAVKK